jgi:hypothetical protein
VPSLGLLLAFPKLTCLPASPPPLARPQLHLKSSAACPQTSTTHMSEVQSRPARGRSTAPRGGRGSYASRGGPRKQTNGDGASSTIDTSAEAGELAELKKRYQSQLAMLKELFPDWTDADLVLAIEDSDGDLERTIEKISEGESSCHAAT